MDCTHAAIYYTVSVVTNLYTQKLYLLHSTLLISAYFKQQNQSVTNQFKAILTEETKLLLH